MRLISKITLAALLLWGSTALAEESQLPAPLVKGLKTPESVAVGVDGRIYVSVIGEFGVDGDGGIMVIEDGEAKPYAMNMDDPKGLVAWKEFLFTTDKNRVWKINKQGKATVFVPAKAFPTEPKFLNDIEADEKGTLYVTDSGDLKGAEGAVYQITQNGEVTTVADAKKFPVIKTPNGLLMDCLGQVLVADFMSGELHSLKLADGTFTKLADGFGACDGIARDAHGRTYISDWKGGKVYVIPRAGEQPILLASGFGSAADIAIDSSGHKILVPDMKNGTVTAIDAEVPGQPVDETPLALTSELAFPKLRWTGWDGGADTGKIVPIRPIVLTHAGDGSNRVFVGTQRGVIHSFANSPDATDTNVYLDISDRVVYNDKQNEEGFLGMAFHPNYKENGELFIYYSTREKPQLSVVSRFRVKKDNPNQADPNSEEVILQIPQPFWNHNGGTIAFGPDGKLYIALGDGGAANDPMGNGQNLKTWLGSILRIDVDQKTKGKNYSVPRDNPFVRNSEAAPEIWAYGFRNIWRMSFDRETGQCWVGEVGQNLWEEINLVEAGGNYGWNLRESLHPFGPDGTGPQAELVEPIWEYHHSIGKSITGGYVYRGKELPELVGDYIYADYVSGKFWALKFDFDKKRVVANRPIPSPKTPVLSFGEDEEGEVYWLTYSQTGQGIYKFVPEGSK